MTTRLLALALLVSGCGSSGVFVGPVGKGDLTVTDRTSMLSGVLFEPIERVAIDADPGAARVGDNAHQIVIGWTGGSCVGPLMMVVSGTVAALAVAVTAPRCQEQSARAVQIVLNFDRAIDPSNVEVTVVFR
ncbi:MAG: hypothetical protein V4515_07325 [Chloroflexota bacterium]